MFLALATRPVAGAAAAPPDFGSATASDAVSVMVAELEVQQVEDRPAQAPVSETVTNAAGEAVTKASPVASGAARSPAGGAVGIAPLAAGENGMGVSGGFATALPFVAFEYARGLGAGIDLGVRYEAVAGLLHMTELRGRWVPIRTEGWNLGLRIGVAGKLFALLTDHMNLTSALYLSPELGGTRRAGRSSSLLFGLGSEVDLVDAVVLDGVATTRAGLRIDAVTARFGWQTRLADELDVFVQARARVPLDPVGPGGEPFFVAPFAEAGACWRW